MSRSWCPFVRTVSEASQVIDLLAGNGLERGRNGLRVIMMCEIPSNALLAEQFLLHFDGFSIGSNDMTQLTLGSTATRRPCRRLVRRARRRREGDAAHGHPGAAAKPASTSAFAARDRPIIRISPSGWSRKGIDTISLNPDTIVATWLLLGQNQRA